MPRKLVSVDIARLEKRSKDAAKLIKLMNGIYKASFEGPSYTGKARFIDRIKKAETIAHNLSFDFAIDVAEANDRKD